ncbi:unnamed protein product [Prorocentrum cordatum]|uniref:Protein-tyrosine sulfotransferase n=1 Tax=Prorocentrum cordatum TaxID=2364126 RepID=A0ABN9YKE1_9DINO|nr:unnamed protein product [Polarella glacialis]
MRSLRGVFGNTWLVLPILGAVLIGGTVYPSLYAQRASATSQYVAAIPGSLGTLGSVGSNSLPIQTLENVGILNIGSVGRLNLAGSPNEVNVTKSPKGTDAASSPNHGDVDEDKVEEANADVARSSNEVSVTKSPNAKESATSPNHGDVDENNAERANDDLARYSNEKRVAMFPNGEDMFCFQGQCSLRRDRESAEFPNFFLGVGPGRSGSTSLISALRDHPSVIVGDARNLYILDKVRECAKGQSAYVDFFTSDTKSKRKTHWFGEKTPMYSSHRLVPFRARAMFGPSLKLFLTWRNPAQIFASRYLQLYEESRATLKDENFRQWADRHLDTFRGIAECRKNLLQKFSLTERMIYDSTFTIHATAAMEEYLVRLCGHMGDGPHAALEGRGMFRRWAHVFGKSQVLCVDVEDQNSRMNWVLDRIAAHLGVDRKGFTDQPSAHKRLNASFDILARNQMRYGSQAVKEMWGSIAEIQAIDRDSLTLEDLRLFSELCGQ